MPAKDIHNVDATERPTAVRYGVLGGLCLAASIAYLCRNSIGVAESTIRKELELSEEAMSWVMGSFFLAYALGQIPTGWLGNRIGSRVAIPLYAIAWSVATAAMSFAGGVTLLVFSRVSNGVAQAGLFPASTSTIGTWFPDTRRAVGSGALAAFMSVGGAIGAALTGTLVASIGWRPTFVGYGGIGIVFAVLFYLWFRDTPVQHSWVNDAERKLIGSTERAPSDPTERSWLIILLIPATWWICGQQFCRAAGQIFFASWFATYLQETRGVSVEESGILNSLPLIGIVTGALVGGAVSDSVLVRTGSRRLARSGVASTCMLLCALFVFGAYFVASPLLAVVTISLGMFFASVGGPCAYTVTIDMGGRHTAMLFATMNMVGNLGAFAFIRLVPEVTKHLSWNSVLVVFGLFYVVAAIFWLLINPNSTVLQQSFSRRSR